MYYQVQKSAALMMKSKSRQRRYTKISLYATLQRKHEKKSGKQINKSISIRVLTTHITSRDIVYE